MPNMKLILTVIVLGLVSAPSWLLADGPLPVIQGIRVFKIRFQNRLRVIGDGSQVAQREQRGEAARRQLSQADSGSPEREIRDRLVNSSPLA